MKRLQIFLLFIFLIRCLFSAPIDFLPVSIQQPNGIIIQCFASGDEYFNWLHDENGFTIIKGSDGWYYYGKVHDGIVIPSKAKVGTDNPVSFNLQAWAKISKEEYMKRRDAMWSEVESLKSNPISAPQGGTFNNLAIYIRFADDSEFISSRQTFDDKLNPISGNSLNSYFYEVSYGTLSISTTHYPACALTTNLSYQDTNPRSYYQPYNATTNPNGYQNSTDRRLREHMLLKNAVEWINIHSPVPAGLNIDADNNGFVDNITFFIRGNAGGWSDLLWAHRWMLYTYDVQINGKRVWDYTFQTENQSTVKVLAHEMFHTLGAPDLYHYYNATSIAPAATWDIMGTGGGHMTAYMKWKYSGQTWINNIPEITTPGMYTLYPLTSATNNCFKIASSNSSTEYFIVEYRKKSGTFESSLPGSGLIIYRVNPSIYGNGDGPPDELYIYRPGGTLTANGNPAAAHFSADVNRTYINDTTDPSLFLSNGLPGGLDIWGITFADSTISFYVGQPANFVVNISSNHTGAGVISGNGIYLPNDTVIVSATANPGYDFLNWTENGNIISTNAMFNFVVTTNRQLVANFSAFSIVCDTLTNVEGTPVNNVFPGGGYASGHNVSNWTEFAEKFTNITEPKIDGIRVKVAIASGSSSSSVIFKIYDDGVYPGTVLASKTVLLNSLVPEEWNYIYFDDPVYTSGSFYAGYAISYSYPNNIDSFAVYMNHYSQTTNNTAFAFTSVGWESYNNLITSVSLGTHLFIEAIQCNPSYDIVLLNNTPGSGNLTGQGTYIYNTPVKATASANPGYSFLHWTLGDSIVSTNAIYEFIADQNKILVANFQSITEIEEMKVQQIHVYPNPATDFVQISGAPAGTELSVLDLSGRVVLRTDLLTNDETIDMTSLKQGIYVFHLRDQGESTSRKVVKQ
jgi:M6 family metalloprotease-like protein